MRKNVAARKMSEKRDAAPTATPRIFLWWGLFMDESKQDSHAAPWFFNRSVFGVSVGFDLNSAGGYVGIALLSACFVLPA